MREPTSEPEPTSDPDVVDLAVAMVEGSLEVFADWPEPEPPDAA